MNKKQTGKEISGNASEILWDDTSLAIQKSLTASLVSQSNSKVSKSDKYNFDTKALASKCIITK